MKQKTKETNFWKIATIVLAILLVAYWVNLLIALSNDREVDLVGVKVSNSNLEAISKLVEGSEGFLLCGENGPPCTKVVRLS